VSITENASTVVSAPFWSDELARALVDAIGTDALRSWLGGDLKDGQRAARPWLRRALVARCWNSRRQRRSLERLWRAHHEEVVDAVDFVGTHGSAEQYRVLLGRFGPADVLLAMITADDDGWELARWFVECQPSDEHRAALRATMQAWLEPALEPCAAAAARIVIFGGHTRDPSRLTRRLFGDSPFLVQWRAEEKGCPQAQRDVRDALQRADAALIITSRVSHSFMRQVKQQAQKYGVPFRCVVKSTVNQLTAALAELFPERSPVW
jgi:hypothetical protein